MDRRGKLHSIIVAVARQHLSDRMGRLRNKKGFLADSLTTSPILAAHDRVRKLADHYPQAPSLFPGHMRFIARGVLRNEHRYHNHN